MSTIKITMLEVKNLGIDKDILETSFPRHIYIVGDREIIGSTPKEASK